MELEGIVSLISTVGFPIVFCFLMWSYINTTLKESTANINSALKEFTLTMAENTRMIEKLCDRLEMEVKPHE